MVVVHCRVKLKYSIIFAKSIDRILAKSIDRILAKSIDRDSWQECYRSLDRSVMGLLVAPLVYHLNHFQVGRVYASDVSGESLIPNDG